MRRRRLTPEKWSLFHQSVAMVVVLAGARQLRLRLWLQSAVVQNQARRFVDQPRRMKLKSMSMFAAVTASSGAQQQLTRAGECVCVSLLLSAAGTMKMSAQSRQRSGFDVRGIAASTSTSTSTSTSDRVGESQHHDRQSRSDGAARQRSKMPGRSRSGGGSREKESGVREVSLDSDDSRYFEPVQGLAAKKFAPSNKAVMSIVKDLTEGHAPRTIFRNAMLSMDTKRKIYELYATDRETNSPEQLAKMFKVSEQRIMAIIALAELRVKHQNDPKNAPLDDNLNVFMEKWYVSEVNGHFCFFSIEHE